MNKEISINLLIIGLYLFVPGALIANDIEVGDLVQTTPYFRPVQFYNHKVGNETSSHLAYTFYVMTDNHVGGFTEGSAYNDYNVPGYQPPFDTGFIPINIPDQYGGPPGKGLSSAVYAVNEDFEAKYMDGVENGEPVFVLHLGDLAARAERAEQEHAKLKMDSLKLPWLPVIGNHDTWPNA